MKIIKTISAILVLTFAINFAANAQAIDDENTVASVSETVEAESTESEAVETINVWPKVSSIKIMVDVDSAENVEIYNITGRKVIEQQVGKGQSINIETLIPGEYVVKVGNKRGTFTKK